MLTVHSEAHKLRDSKTELFGGELVYPHERPSRVQYVLDRIAETGLGEVRAPNDYGMEPILRVHDAAFVEFLRTAWDEWTRTGFKGEAMPICWPARRMVLKIPDYIEGRLGYYALSSETSISPGTWEASLAAANVALTGAEVIGSGEHAVFSLCRPPGHHAARDMYGGYCFLNNAAIAAQYYLDHGAERVAVLDVDFHHGNGTQDIFYERGDVVYLSLHGDPREAFPHFLGYADETGQGEGAGCNFNYPMAPGTGYDKWGDALGDAIANMRKFGAEVLVLSLGVDAFENDPISFFKLTSDDYTTCGAAVAGLGIPTHFVMEGGYDIEEIGINTVNVLQGFEKAY